MLQQIAEGVWVHESDVIQSSAVVVQGNAGVLVVDAGIKGAEIVSIADDLQKMGQSVAVGFSTHPHWDHVLWHERLGEAPRYGTARCAAEMQSFLANPDWKTDITEDLPEEAAGDIPLDLLGQIAGLETGAVQLPWDGPKVRIIEHSAHAPGHAALLVEGRRVLIAGDMLSDVLIPMLNLAADDPVADYLAGLEKLEAAASDVDVFIPGHGSVGKGDELRTRIDLDRAYVEALRDGKDPDDPRLATPKEGWEWVASVHGWQAKQIAAKKK